MNDLLLKEHKLRGTKPVRLVKARANNRKMKKARTGVQALPTYQLRSVTFILKAMGAVRDHS